MITAITSSSMSLVFIVLLGVFYDQLAWKMTEFELPKTEQKFAQYYAVKVFCFQCVNYYSPLFYIAFFKNYRVGIPNTHRTVNIGNEHYHWRGCDQSGCNYELGVQLLITFVGKNILNQLIENAYPRLKRAYFFSKSKMDESSKQWHRDYLLNTDISLTIGKMAILISKFEIGLSYFV